MSDQPFAKLSIRFQGDNPNHHMWNNNGVWFIHYTIHDSPVTQKRMRHSLKTRYVGEARQRRDQILQEFQVG